MLVELVDLIIDFLPMMMFASLALLLFTGYPVAFILGGLALIYGFLGIFFDIFSFIQFFNFLPRIWGQAAENLVLVAVPTFVFMGVMMVAAPKTMNALLRGCVLLLNHTYPLTSFSSIFWIAIPPWICFSNQISYSSSLLGTPPSPSSKDP